MAALIDLSTDVVSPPTEAMWEAMRGAELGLASQGRDTSVNTLEEMAAHRMGKEAALFVATGTLGNLLAVMTHTQRGEQVILERYAHILWAEEWALASLCGLLARAVDGTNGALDPKAVEEALTEARFRHLPRTGLVCLENTHNGAGGTILTPAQTRALCHVAHHHGVPVHLDGARVFNAAIALGVDVRELVDPVDTVMFCLSKGLSAPIGSMLCGTRDFVDKARLNRRVLGAGSIHKWGIAAAAGIVALNTMVERLAEDNRTARTLAEALNQVEGMRVDLDLVQTNIVMVDVTASGRTGEVFLADLEKQGVRCSFRAGNVLRLVTHRLIGPEEVEATVDAFRRVAAHAATP